MVVRVRPRQLALALPHAESLTRDNFMEGAANAQALALIDGWPDWPNRVMMLVGPEGSGKSHLASIWAAEAGARSVAAHTLTPANVPGELTTGALVVDDLDPASFDELPPVLYWLDRCHTGFDGWRMVVYTDCGAGGPFFLIEGPAGAYAESEQIAARMLAALTGGEG